MLSTATFLELERPTEWLRHLEEQPGSWHRLLAMAGSLPRAAHRVATARGRVMAVPCAVPTRREVLAAAAEVARRTGHAVPLPTVVLEECERAGLPVIGPLRTHRAA